jgi:hypothetical protein
MKNMIAILAGLFMILLNTGCNKDTKSTPGIGFIPYIKNNFITIFNANNPDNLKQASSFNNVNDYISFGFIANDPDLNIKTLYVTEYFPADSEIVYNSTEAISLPEQVAELMTYTNIDRRKITEAPGEYRINIQIEDETGNKSDIASASFKVE